MSAALEARLERLETERALRELSSRYCHGADDSDIATFLEVWAPEPVWDVGIHRFTGAVEIEQAVRRQWESIATMLHATSNSTFDVESESLARGRHDVVSVAVLHDGRRMLTTGRYDDVYVRTTSGWRFRERRATVSSSSLLGPEVG